MVSLEWQELQDRAYRLIDPWVTNPAQRIPRSLDYSWSNGSKIPSKLRARRLDRIYLLTAWMAKVKYFGIASATVRADHAPVLVERSA